MPGWTAPGSDEPNPVVGGARHHPPFAVEAIVPEITPRADPRVVTTRIGFEWRLASQTWMKSDRETTD